MIRSRSRTCLVDDICFDTRPVNWLTAWYSCTVSCDRAQTMRSSFRLLPAMSEWQSSRIVAGRCPEVRTDHEDTLAQAANGTFQLPIAATFPLAAAHEQLESRTVMGKLLLVVSGIGPAQDMTA